MKYCSCSFGCFTMIMKNSLTNVFVILVTLVALAVDVSSLRQRRQLSTSYDELLNRICSRQPSLEFCATRVGTPHPRSGRATVAATTIRSTTLSERELTEDTTVKIEIETTTTKTTETTTTTAAATEGTEAKTTTSAGTTTTTEEVQPRILDTPEEIDAYCNDYVEHYAHFCEQFRNPEDEAANRFCTNYRHACDRAQREAEEKEKIRKYCVENQKFFDQYCEDPLKYGVGAMRFCPVFAEHCGGTISTPLIELIDPFDLVGASESHQRDRSRQPGVDLIDSSDLTRPSQTSRRGRNRRPTGDLIDPSDQTRSSQVHQRGRSRRPGSVPNFVPRRRIPADVIRKRCNKTRQLAETYCGTPLARSGQIAERCKMYRTYCLHLD